MLSPGRMGMSKGVYVDANIFISVFLEREGCDKIREFFKSGSGDFEFYTSDWTLTEAVKVLVNEYKVDSDRVAAYIESLSREKRICGVKFGFVGVSPDDGYDFEEFFYGVQKTVLEYRNGVQDAIHSLIMENNGIGIILTADAGFEGIEGVEVVNPLVN